MERPMWAHQVRAIDMTAQAIRDGFRAIAITIPTGGGKTAVATELSRRAVAKGKRVAIYTNRKILTNQATRTLTEAGVDHGVMAAGYETDMLPGVQIVSIQTIASRVYARDQWDLPHADLVIIDEGHSNKASTGSRIIADYKGRGAVVLCLTATPVGLGELHEVNGKSEPLYSKLVVAATVSELRKCGALVRCDVYAPDEPDMRGVKMSGGEYVAKQAAERAMETLVFGNVFDKFEELNPWHTPTILWAPSVGASLWFVEQFQAKGVPAAHIDGSTPDHERKGIFEKSKLCELAVVCSCGVLREGVDLPWIRHGILIQPCGALSTYLQIVGRGLRAYPLKDRFVLQDHAGASHRHGSPNADREWTLEDTDVTIARRMKQARESGEPQPIICPKCAGVRAAGATCPHCGHQHKRSVRHVRMTDGKLVRMVGDVVKRKKQQTPEQKLWTSCLYAAAARGHSVAQAAGNYYRQAGKMPAGLQFCPPHNSLDWQRPVTDVFPWIGRRRAKA